MRVCVQQQQQLRAQSRHGREPVLLQHRAREARSPIPPARPPPSRSPPLCLPVSLCTTPAASLGQVYKAVLRDTGEEVAVKVG